MSDLYDLLPEPTPLSRTAVIKYRCDEESYEIFCYAACIRTVAWEEANEPVTWLHCLAALSPERKRKKPINLMKLLVPVQYITSIETGASFRASPATRHADVGVFPPEYPGPPNQMPFPQIKRIIDALQAPAGKILLAAGGGLS